jgi:hypothetical protein
MTRTAEGPALAALGRADPAALHTRDNVTRWGELRVMTTAPRAPEGPRLRPPHRIMTVVLPYQGVGDLMQNGVGNVSLRRRPCIRLRQGDDSCIIVAAPPARLVA